MAIERGAPRMALTTAIAAAAHALALVGLLVARPSRPVAAIALDTIDAPSLTFEVTLETALESAGVAAEAPFAARAETALPARAPDQERARAPALLNPPGTTPTANPETNPGTDPGTEESASEVGSDPDANAMATPPPIAPLGPMGAAVLGAAPPAPPASARPDAPPPPLLPRADRAPSAVFGRPVEPPEGSSQASAGAQILGTVRAIATEGAPRNGHGTIRIEVDAAGAVVRVTSSSPSFSNVAQAIRSALSGRRLRVPSGGRGVLITFAVEADITKAPRAITGETKATPCKREEKNQAGRVDALPEPGCIDALALLPIERHRVSVKLLSEQAL